MAISKIDIINKALHHLGTERINLITDQNKRAKVMTDIYDITKKSCLEDGFWGFAKKRVNLSALATVPLYEYAYEFNKPADCIKPVKEYNDEPYVVEGSKILADTNTLDLIYIWDIEDASTFTPGFIETLAFKLARDACYTLIQSSERYNFLDRAYEKQISMARSNMDSQQPPVEIEISDFINVRY